MRLRSHVLIANHAIDIIEEITGIQLNKKYVRLGSIIPDIHPLRRMQVHDPDIVSHHVNREFRRIIDKKKKIKRISYIIGLLTHYVSDAFCLSHNKYVVNLKKHVQYEHFLDRNKLKAEVQMEDLMGKVEQHIQMFVEEKTLLTEYVMNMNEKYLDIIADYNWETNYKYDLEQAIIHSAVLLSQFISGLQQNHIAAFA